MMAGKISIIMGIYNCADTLSAAIDCILKQTYTNWELILCDDGSADNTYQVAFGYYEKHRDKIILIRNENNCGLNQTLNNCLALASGEYIARMDGDDLCSPERFEKEVAVLEHESEISIVSTDMLVFDETGVTGRVSHPDYPQKKDFVFESPFCHAPCLVRKAAFDSVEGYTVADRFIRIEDYHLWIKMYSAGYKGKNIHEALYKMRDDNSAYKRRNFKNRLNEAYIKRFAVREFGLPKWMLIYSLRPIITWMLPKGIYKKLHRTRLNQQITRGNL